VKAIDRRSSTPNLVEELQQARQAILMNSQRVRSAAAALRTAMGDFASRKGTVFVAALGGVLIERAVHGDGSRLRSLLKAAVSLREISAIARMWRAPAPTATVHHDEMATKPGM
jgi:hypothetical protein